MNLTKFAVMGAFQKRDRQIKEHVSAHELENQIDIIVAKRAGREGQLRDITDAKAMTEEEQKEIRRAKGHSTRH